jgi:hypothetical protein
MSGLVLKRGRDSRPSGVWKDDDVLADGKGRLPHQGGRISYDPGRSLTSRLRAPLQNC